MHKIYGALTLLSLLGGCAAPPSTTTLGEAAGNGSQDLACALSSNCVNSLDSGGLMPLRYVGTAVQALGILQATLATFPEAQLLHADPLALKVIFTTPAGFKDQVDFRIDEQSRRIDFRSRSLFGLFDFGKNRSRMQEFALRFEAQRMR